MPKVTVASLKKECKTLGIKGYSSKRKPELIELLAKYKADNNIDDIQPQPITEEQKVKPTEKKENKTNNAKKVNKEKKAKKSTKKPVKGEEEDDDDLEFNKYDFQFKYMKDGEIIGELLTYIDIKSIENIVNNKIPDLSDRDSRNVVAQIIWDKMKNKHKKTYQEFLPNHTKSNDKIVEVKPCEQLSEHDLFVISDDDEM